MDEIDLKRFEHVEGRNGVSDVQGMELFRLARESGGPIVEIGSHRGRSTVFLAAGAKAGGWGPVYALDPWDFTRTSLPKDMHEVTRDMFLQNIKKAGFEEIVVAVPELSWVVRRNRRPSQIFERPLGMIFIDGDHSEKAVLKDLEWVKDVRVGGSVVLHDYESSNILGPIKALSRYMNDHPGTLELVKVIEVLGVFGRVQ